MSNPHQNHHLRSCLWLTRVLQLYKRITLKEIQDLWANDDISKGRKLPRNTFADIRNSAEDILGLVIECDRRTNEYYIAESDNSKLSDWLISSFNISSLMQEQQDIRDRILLDAPPRGIEHFTLIIDAFRNDFALEMTYRKFTDSAPYTCYIEPYCLKHDHQRWYLLARKDHRPNLQTFALDRIVKLEALRDRMFKPEEDFSPKRHFEHSFGVFVGQQEPQKISIKAFGVGRDYLRTAPLHPTQQEMRYDGETSLFTIRCRPTRDLMLHLMSQGADIEILEPQSFRQEMEEELKKLVGRYELS